MDDSRRIRQKIGWRGRRAGHAGGRRLEETRAFLEFLRDEISQVMAKWRKQRLADPAQ